MEESSLLITSEIFKNIVDESFNEIFIFEAKTLLFVYANTAALDNSGYGLDELLCMTPLDIKPDISEGVFEKKIKKLREKRESITILETRHERKDKTTYDVEARIQMMKIDDKDFFIAMALDVTEKREHERQRLQTQKQLAMFAQAIEQTDDLIRIVDINGDISYVNDSFVAHTGFPHRELIGNNSRILKSGEHDDSFYQGLWKTLLLGKTFRCQFINKTKDGKIYYEDATLSPIFGDTNKLERFIVTGKDVTQKIHYEKELKERAVTDELTGLFNRRKGNRVIASEIERMRRYESSFAILFLDIDRFKEINDTYGHDAGDKVLVQLSQLIKQRSRQSDTFIRWGGEEFIIIAPSLNEEQASNLAEKLRQSVALHPFENVDTLTISIGLTTSKADDESDTILKRADKALYTAKDSGRNCVVIG